LTAKGVFVIEAFVPDLTRFTRNQNTEVSSLDALSVRLEASRHDRALQRVDSHHVLITEAGIKLYPIKMRYAWPSELDLMARLAGLQLRDRWADWGRQQFTSGSSSHVSVYERA